MHFGGILEAILIKCGGILEAFEGQFNARWWHFGGILEAIVIKGGGISVVFWRLFN